MSNLTSIRETLPTITIAGKDYVVRFDMNAFAELEKIYGSVEEAFKALEKERISDVRNAVWAGIAHDLVSARHPFTGEPESYAMTPYELGSHMDMQSLNTLGPVLLASMVGSLPEEQLAEAEALMEDAGLDAGPLAKVVQKQ